MDPNTKQIKILLADDDLDLREMYTQKLVSEGFAVLAAASGKEALELLGDNCDSIDLVLLDVIMPGMDGFDVLEKIKNTHKCKNIPVIMLTSLNEAEDRQTGLELGADEYFVKPENTPADLAAAIKEVLAEKSKQK